MRAGDQSFDELVEPVVHHIVVRTLAGVPQLKARREHLAGVEDHQP
jgi:hypothetical protein